MASMSSSSNPPRQRRIPRDETRRRLIDAAGRVFADRGYTATSMEEVAAAAGFSKGAVYSNFESKQDLFMSLMRARIEERVVAVRRVASAAGGPREQAEGAGDEMRRLLVEQPEWHRLFIEFWAQAMREADLRVALVDARRPMREQIASLLEEQSERHQLPLPAKAEDLAVIILALSNGLAIEQMIDPGIVDAGIHGTAFALLLRTTLDAAGASGERS